MVTSNLRVTSLGVIMVVGSFKGRHCLGSGVLVVIEHLLETVEVETVSDVLLVDSAEEVVVL